MSSDNRYSFIREMRRLRERRIRIARYIATRKQTPTGNTDGADVSEAADTGREADAVISHRLRASGYDPDRWRNDPNLLMARMMRLFTIVAITGLGVVVIVATAGSAYAATKTGTTSVLAAGDVDALNGVINNLRVWLVRLLLAVAALFLTIGFFRLAMADGDPGEVERGKRALKSAAIGLAGALLAPVIVTVIQGLFTQ